MKLYKLLKSVLDQDLAPVVVCDIDDIIVYMNPSAIERYHKDLTGSRCICIGCFSLHKAYLIKLILDLYLRISKGLFSFSNLSRSLSA